jgi:hypothetical protein
LLDNSPGGNLLESVEIGKLVRQQKMKTCALFGPASQL